MSAVALAIRPVGTGRDAGALYASKGGSHVEPCQPRPRDIFAMRLVSILIAVWLATRFEPRIASIFQGGQPGSLPPVPRTLLWLALGTIFAIPLFDLIGLIQTLI
ncbi:MAG TPA: hypothetical protein VJP78_15370, partial [Thermoleophilia bacterium]|nr:hypothetical protein [Thermoleophilia bacterium]